VDVVARVLEAHGTRGAALPASGPDATSPGVPSEEQLTVDDILAADAWARAEADRLILEGEPTA
ncbi:MAG TPA: hypothetical protein VF728_08620, partial [Nocardioides sp.]